MTPRTRTRALLLRASVVAAATFCGTTVQAQAATAAAATATAAGAAGTEAAASTLSLRQVYEAAWARQPEALALQARRNALDASLNAQAARWDALEAITRLLVDAHQLWAADEH